MYRRKAGLDAKTLAKKAGITASHLSRMENDVLPVSLLCLGALCNVLGTSPWKVLKMAEEYAVRVKPVLDSIEDQL